MASDIIAKLLELQQRDRRLKILTSEAAEIPARKEQLSSRLEQQRQAVEQATEAHRRLQADIKEIEIDVELSREKINRYRKQQMEVKDNESYRALDNEIRGLTRHIRQQEDAQLEHMVRLDSAAATLAEATEVLDGQIKEIAVEEAELDQRLAELQVELDAHNGERSAMVEGLEPSWLSRYERTFSHVGDYALVTSNNGLCGGCHMKIPPALVLRSKSTEKITTCTFCGRMLYFEA